jgi:membrane protein DedA with SNARE-associated domain
VPSLAGMHKVPYRTFLKWNAAGGIVFSTTVIVLGYQFASSLASLEKYLKFWAIFALIAIISVIFILKNKLEKMIEE